MAQNDIYIITPTDGNATREFNISPYTSDGYDLPNSLILTNGAVSAHSSLTLHGKGKDSYGEKLQENFYHLLEHFSSYIEPTKPVIGQVWFDNNDNTMKVFVSNMLEIIDISNNTILIRLEGNTTSKYYGITKTSIMSRLIQGLHFDIFDKNQDLIGTYIISSDATDILPSNFTINPNDVGKVISIELINTIDVDVPPIVEPQYLGLWIPLSNISTNILDNVLNNPSESYKNIYGQLDDINLASNKIINLADPIDPNDGLNLGFADSKYLLNTNGTMNGTFTTNDLVVNNTVSIHNGVLDLTGTSTLINLLEPLNPSDAATMNYVDTQRKLSKLDDVDITSIVPINDDVLYFDSVSGKWKGKQLTLSSGGASNLGTLTDVSITSISNNQIITYDAVSNLWKNENITLNGFDENDFLKLTGGTTTGVVSMTGQPQQNGTGGIIFDDHAVTVGYMNDSIANYVTNILPNGDVHLSSVVYTGSTDSLTFQLTDTSTITLSNMGSEIQSNLSVTANNINYDLLNDQDYLTSHHVLDSSYPTIFLSEGLDTLSRVIKQAFKPNKSTVLQTDGIADIYNIDRYICGYNKLQVYVNGLKSIANVRSYNRIIHNSILILPSTLISTLLNISYSFNIIMDGYSETVTIDGSNITNFAELINAINAELTLISNNINIINGLNLFQPVMVLEEGILIIYSGSTDISSNIVITDVDLFSTITGLTIDNSVPSIIHDYGEIGSYLNISSSIKFNDILSIGATIETISSSVYDVYATKY